MRLDTSHPLYKDLIGCWFSKDPAMQNLCTPHQSNDVTPGSTTTPAPEDGGIRLDSTCGFVTNTDQPDLDADSNYFWLIKYKIRAQVSAGNVIFGNRFDSYSGLLRFFKITEDNVQYYNSGNDLNMVHPRVAGETYDLCVVKEGSNFTLYLDGEIHATDTSSKTLSRNPVYVANGRNSSISEATDIVIYHAAHGTVAPTHSQILSLYKDPEQLLYKANDDYYPRVVSGAYNLASDSGTYTYTGTNAELDADFVITTDSGSYTYSGTNVDLNFGFTLATDSGSYTYTGTSAELDAGFVVVATSGSYTYSGTATALDRGFYLATDSGAYTYSGTNVTLTFAGAGSFTITCDSGTYTYTGTSAELDASFVIDTTSGSYSYSGTSVTLTRNAPISADSGSYTYAGTNIAFDFDAVIAATSGSYNYSGSNISLTASGQTWVVQSNDSSTWTAQTNDSSNWTIQ